MIAAASRHADALHALGALARQAGRPAVADGLVTQAIGVRGRGRVPTHESPCAAGDESPEGRRAGWAPRSCAAGRLGAAFPRRRHSRPPVCRTAMARRAARRLTLLVHSEQGLGDVIQFARYLPVIAGKVVLEAPPRLMRLLSSNPALSHMIPAGGTPPPIDTVIPLLSLPARTRITPSEPPYLFAEPDRVAAWRDRIGPAGRGSVSPGRAVPADSRTRADRCRWCAFAPLAAVPASG